MGDRTLETVEWASVAAHTAGGLDPIDGAVGGLVLAFAEGGRRGPERLLLPTDGITLGRSTTAFPGGPLTDDRMSRRHAEVVPDGLGGWLLRDLSSRNGSYVRDRKVSDDAHHLASGDVIRLGNCLFVFRPLSPGLDAPGELLPGFVGASEVMQRIGATAQAVAPHDTSVLITGETGTGKEVVARAIHALSGRPGAFVAMNCGGVPEGLLASELFGHRKGAFTGASEARPGLFRSADGGTLLLDEIGEMPAELQVQLLRVLESQTVRSVGGTREHTVDVRVLAATHRDLLADVRAERFRSDLFARLHQWPIVLPPLRDRCEDVPMLIRHFADLEGPADVEVDPDLVEALMLHPWPLNVRALRNVVTVAMIGRHEGPLGFTTEVRQLLDADRSLFAAPSAPPADADVAEVPGTLQRTQPILRRIAPPPQPEALREALEASGGSVAAAARSLGCSRQQVYRQLDHMGWALDEFRD